MSSEEEKSTLATENIDTETVMNEFRQVLDIPARAIDNSLESIEKLLRECNKSLREVQGKVHQMVIDVTVEAEGIVNEAKAEVTETLEKARNKAQEIRAAADREAVEAQEIQNSGPEEPRNGDVAKADVEESAPATVEPSASKEKPNPAGGIDPPPSAAELAPAVPESSTATSESVTAAPDAVDPSTVLAHELCKSCKRARNPKPPFRATIILAGIVVLIWVFVFCILRALPPIDAGKLATPLTLLGAAVAVVSLVFMVVESDKSRRWSGIKIMDWKPWLSLLFSILGIAISCIGLALL